MRVYIASGFENADRVRSFAARLPDGWSWSYDWTVHTFDDDPLDVARSDMQGITLAHAVVVLLPGGPSTHAELGIAMGSGTKVCVVGDMPRKDPRWPRCPFWCLADRVATEVEALEWLKRKHWIKS
jgi:hypothetical protein